MFEQSLDKAKARYGDSVPESSLEYLRRILPTKKETVLASNLSTNSKAQLVAQIDADLQEIGE